MGLSEATEPTHTWIKQSPVGIVQGLQALSGPALCPRMTPACTPQAQGWGMFPSCWHLSPPCSLPHPVTLGHGLRPSVLSGHHCELFPVGPCQVHRQLCCVCVVPGRLCTNDRQATVSMNRLFIDDPYSSLLQYLKFHSERKQPRGTGIFTLCECVRVRVTPSRGSFLS